MDDSRFDDLAKVLTVPSRRGIFTAAATAALASLAAFVGRGSPDATRAAKKKRKKSGAKSRPGPAGPQGAQGPPGPVSVAYAHVRHTDGSFDPARSKGVISIEKFDNLYCFNLAFKARVAVGATFINNSGVVATWTDPDSATLACSMDHLDAAARIFASDSGDPRGDVSFKIVFF